MVFLEGLAPIMLGGYWLPEIIALAGARDALQQAGDEPMKSDWKTIKQARPDVLVVSCDPDKLTDALHHMAELAALPGWWSLPAVYNSDVYVVNESCFVRGSLRVVDGVRVLGKIVCPRSGGGYGGLPPNTCWKLSMNPGQRCRPKLLPNYFLPYGLGDSRRDSFE